MGARAGPFWRPRAACTSIVSVDMDDEDGRCLLDVICDPEALNDFLHGSETHGHVSEVQAPAQISAGEPPGLPRVSVDLDFLEDDILGGSPGGAAGEDGGSNGVGSNHEPCDILQQSLAEANITEQSLQEAEAELDLSSFGLSGLTQVVQPLPDPSLSGAGGAAVGVGIGVGVGGPTPIFSGPASGSSSGPTNATPDMLGSVLAHQGIQLQPQVMNKAISVQPFMPPVGLGNVTLQPISSIQALPNGNQPGHLGLGPIQVVGQPTVMTINQPGQQILTKAMGGYQLHQPGQEGAAAGTQAGLGSSVLSSGGGLLIQGGKANIGSSTLNGPAVGVSSANTNSSVSTMTAQGGLVGFGAQPSAQTQGQIMQIIQRTPTPIQPKPPQATIQPRLFQPKQQQQHPVPHTLQNDASKAVGVQPVPVSTPNVTFLTGKPGSNVVLSTQATSQAGPFPQTLFKQQAAQASGKPLSVQLLNQSGSIVIPSQTVLQGQNHQFLLPQLQPGGQILTQHPGGIITSQGPGGQIIANQILTANQNINIGQVLASQGHPGAAHILSGPIQLQPGQMGHPTLFQMPVTLAQTQTQAHPITGHAQTVIHPIQNSLAMLSQVDGVSPAVSLQPTLQQQGSAVASSNTSGAVAMAPCQPGEGVTVLGNTPDQGTHPAQAQPSILTVQTALPTSLPSSVPSSSPSCTVVTSSAPIATVPLTASSAQHSPGKVLLAPQGSGMILSQESLMFLQQDQEHQTDKDPSLPSLGVPASVIVSGNFAGLTPSGQDGPLAGPLPGQSPSPSPGATHLAAVVPQVSTAGPQQPLKIQTASPSQPVMAASAVPHSMADSPQPSQASPLTVGQRIQSPLPQTQPAPQAQTQTPSRSCTPSSLPSLFIIHNNPIAGSPQPAQPIPQILQQQQQSQPPPPPQQIQTQIQVPLQAQQTSRPPSQPAPIQPEVPPPACSPKPPQVHPAQFHFAQPGVTAAAPGGLVKPQVQIPPLLGLTPDQQHNLQLICSQLQTLSAISQPSPKQKQLMERLQQVQQNLMLTAKHQQQQQQQQQQTQAVQTPVAGQFQKLPEPPATQVITSSAITCPPVTAPSTMPQKSVLVKPSATVLSDAQVFPGVVGASVNQAIMPQSLNQPVQAKQGVISAVGGIPVGKGTLQIQVLNPALSQMPAPQPAAPGPVQTQQTPALKMPFIMSEPSKEARMLEQLRKQQGSVLHPDYSSPFRSFEDSLHRLLPYHLYQGTASSQHDYQKVDSEFENVSCQLLKRTRAMLDKYRHLLFEESKQRLGPSAEMVMIDRMFIQEEKIALSQDRILARERPEEFVANSCLLDSVTVSSQRPVAVETNSVRPAAPPPSVGPVPPIPAPVPAPAPAPAPTPTLTPTPSQSSAPAPPSMPYPPTKLVIKQGGGGASVSWSTSCASAPAPTPPLRVAADSSVPPPSSSSSFSRTPSAPSRPSHHHHHHHHNDDDDALPQRTSKPPIKTYEARQRIGLKLKIKQEAGLSKVVHNTALDPVHSQPQHHSQPPTPEVQPPPAPPPPPQQQPQPKVPPSLPPSTASVIRTPATPPATCNSVASSSNSTVTTHSGLSQRDVPPSYPWSSSSSSSSSSSTSQMNGSVEHHDVAGPKCTPVSTSTPCRLPLRKTYRENVSPRIRPGVPGGGCEVVSNPPPPVSSTPAFPPALSPPPSQLRASPQPERTVIASVKLEHQGGRGQERSGVSSGASGGEGAAQGASQPLRSPPGLAEVEDVFCRGIKNAYHRHHRHRPPEQAEGGQGEEVAAAGTAERDSDGGALRSKRFGGKNRERPSGTFRMDQHAPGPPSPSDGSSFARDSSLPAKRCKSDSPDMDNASFSSGSPPPDDSLNEHLQCAIDSILNLQQGPVGHASGRAVSGRPAGPHVHHHPHQPQRTVTSSSSSYRPSSSTAPSSSSAAQQVGGRGQNGSLVTQTHNR